MRLNTYNRHLSSLIHNYLLSMSYTDGVSQGQWQPKHPPKLILMEPVFQRLTPARDASYRHLSLLKRSEMSTVKCREHRGVRLNVNFKSTTQTRLFYILNALFCPWLSVPAERIYTESYFDLQVNCDCALCLAFALSQTAKEVGTPLLTTPWLCT